MNNVILYEELCELINEKDNIETKIKNIKETILSSLREKYPIIFTIVGFASTTMNASRSFRHDSKLYFTTYDNVKELLNEKGDTQMLKHNKIEYIITVVPSTELSFSDFKKIDNKGDYFYAT